MVDRVFHVSRLYLKRRGQSIYPFRSFAISTRCVPFHHHLTKTPQPIFLKKKKDAQSWTFALRSPHLQSVTLVLFLHDDTSPYHYRETYHHLVTCSFLFVLHRVSIPVPVLYSHLSHHTDSTYHFPR